MANNDKNNKNGKKPFVKNNKFLHLKTLKQTHH